MPSSSSADPARGRVRRALRRQRRELDPRQRIVAEAALLARLQGLPELRRARTLAAYLPFDAEPDLRPLMRAFHAAHRAVYVPVLSGSSLRFVRWLPGQSTRENHLGIAEPVAHIAIEPRRLDVVLVPVLAFDGHGTRLGYGGGYYDRSFAFLSRRARWQRPKLIGVGFQFQFIVHGLQRAVWDVPLFGAVTESATYRFG